MDRAVFGVNPVLELLKNQPEKVEEIWIHNPSGKKFRIVEIARKKGIPLKIVRKSEFHPPKLGERVNTQGVVAYLKGFEYASLEDIVSLWEKKGELPLVIFVDEVEDPRNLGAIARSAEIFGSHGIVIPKHRNCEVTETVIKTSCGAVFNLPVCRVTNLKQAINFFKDKGLWILGLTHRASQNLWELDLKIPLGIVVGNEGRGIRQKVLELCDFQAKIPMKGQIESLNVSVATGIALYEVLRQRNFKTHQVSSK